MKWINVRKQKPPLNTPILIFQRFKYGTIIKIAEYVLPPARTDKHTSKKRPVFASHIEREKDGYVYGGYPEENVTHWMPLPEPPKLRKPYKE